MQSFLFEYGIFLAKAVTIIAAILMTVVGVVAIGAAQKKPREQLDIKKINRRYEEFAESLREVILSKQELKTLHKVEKKKQKEEEKQPSQKRRIFVIDFEGDINASAAKTLADEVTAVLLVARTEDEVVVRVNSVGGVVHGYGLAASQLQRIRKHGIPLTVSVDKVAASGGYLMACVANRIIAAPFAIIGSIGVVAQLPNFNRLLKRHDIDFELHTAGQYKRTLTLFGENTEEGREKFREELETVHELFQNFIREHRPQVDLASVATGEYWHGSRAIELQLVDELTTSDDYLLNLHETTDLFEVSYKGEKKWLEKVMEYFESRLQSWLYR